MRAGGTFDALRRRRVLCILRRYSGLPAITGTAITPVSRRKSQVPGTFRQQTVLSLLGRRVCYSGLRVRSTRQAATIPSPAWVHWNAHSLDGFWVLAGSALRDRCRTRAARSAKSCVAGTAFRAPHFVQNNFWMHILSFSLPATTGLIKQTADSSYSCLGTPLPSWVVLRCGHFLQFFISDSMGAFDFLCHFLRCVTRVNGAC